MPTSFEQRSEDNAASSKARRKPSTGFPVVALPEAAKIVREAGKYGFQHSVSAFARYMGHTTTNSGSFRQRLAAFRDWKLITGRGDTIVFTETGKTIALPPDAAAEREALQTAFMNCSVFATLYEGVAKRQQVQAQKLGAKAVHELGVAPSAVDKFTASFVDSAVAAGLAMVENDNIVLIDQALNVNDMGEPPDDEGEFQVAEPPTGHSAKRVLALHAAPVVHQWWSLPAGAVLFEVSLDRPLPAAAFAQVGTVVKQIEALAGQLQELVAADETDR